MADVTDRDARTLELDAEAATGPAPSGPSDESELEPVRLVNVKAVAPEGYVETCLRPLGLCELGGSCDACWYGPNNPASPLRRR